MTSENFTPLPALYKNDIAKLYVLCQTLFSFEFFAKLLIENGKIFRKIQHFAILFVYSVNILDTCNSILFVLNFSVFTKAFFLIALYKDYSKVLKCTHTSKNLLLSFLKKTLNPSG